jgi:hypothetical protein
LAGSQAIDLIPEVLVGSQATGLIPEAVLQGGVLVTVLILEALLGGVQATLDGNQVDIPVVIMRPDIAVGVEVEGHPAGGNYIVDKKPLINELA